MVLRKFEDNNFKLKDRDVLASLVVDYIRNKKIEETPELKKTLAKMIVAEFPGEEIVRKAIPIDKVPNFFSICSVLITTTRTESTMENYITNSKTIEMKVQVPETVKLAGQTRSWSCLRPPIK